MLTTCIKIDKILHINSTKIIVDPQMTLASTDSQYNIPHSKHYVIYHLADLHIRAQLRNEFRYAIQKVYEYIEQDITPHPKICIIAGDIFHNKETYGAEDIQEFNNMIKTLSALCKIVITIPGNHDKNLNISTDMDLIYPLTSSFTKNYIHLNKTAIQPIASNLNVIFIHPSIKSTKQESAAIIDAIPETQPNVCNLLVLHEDIVPFPSQETLISVDSETFNYTGISSSSTYVSSDARFNMNDLTQKCTLTLLGHIHEYTKFSDRIAYAGALVQQNIGETFVKGFIRWRLIYKDFWKINHKFIPVYNAQSSIKFLLRENTLHVYSKAAYLTLLPQTPKKIDIDVYKSDKECIDKIKTQITSHFAGKIPHIHPKDTLQIENIQIVSNNQTDRNNILINWENPDQQINMLKTILNASKKFHNAYAKCLKDYGCLMVTHDQTTITNKILDKHKQWLKTITMTSSCNNSKLELLDLIWDNLGPFGANNFIDFKALDGSIVGLVGNNFTGKSTVIDILMMGLFQSPFRGSIKNLLHNKESHGTLQLRVQINDTIFINTKYWTPQGAKDGYQIKKSDGSTVENVTSLHKSVDASFIENTFGNLQMYLTTVVMTQDKECDFLNMQPAQRYAFLRDNILDLKGLFAQETHSNEQAKLLEKILNSDKVILKNEPDTNELNQQLISCENEIKQSDQKLSEYNAELMSLKSKHAPPKYGNAEYLSERLESRQNKQKMLCIEIDKLSNDSKIIQCDDLDIDISNKLEEITHILTNYEKYITSEISTEYSDQHIADIITNSYKQDRDDQFHVCTPPVKMIQSNIAKKQNMLLDVNSKLIKRELISKQISEYESQITNLQLQQQQLQNDLLIDETALSNIKQIVTHKNMILTELQTKYDDCIKHKQKASEYKLLKFNMSCSSCVFNKTHMNQSVDSIDINQISQELDDATQQMNIATQQQISISTKLIQKREQLKNCQTQIDQITQVCTKYVVPTCCDNNISKIKLQLENELSTLKTQLDTQYQYFITLKNILTKRIQYQTYRKKLNIIRDEIKQLSKSILIAKKEQKAYENISYQIDEINSCIHALMLQKHKLESEKVNLTAKHAARHKYENNAKDYVIHKLYGIVLGNGGLQSTIINNALQQITVLANETLEQIIPGELKIITSTSEKTDTTILQTDKINIKFESNTGILPIVRASGFQKFVISLAFRHTFARICKKPVGDFLILDEGFPCMDPINLNRIIDVLPSLKSTYKFIFIISHDMRLHAAFDKILTIEEIDKTHKNIQSHKANPITMCQQLEQHTQTVKKLQSVINQSKQSHKKTVSDTNIETKTCHDTIDACQENSDYDANGIKMISQIAFECKYCRKIFQKGKKNHLTAQNHIKNINKYKE